MAYGPWWKDIIPVQVGGRTSLDVDGMDARIGELVARVVGRADGRGAGQDRRCRVTIRQARGG